MTEQSYGTVDHEKLVEEQAEYVASIVTPKKLERKRIWQYVSLIGASFAALALVVLVILRVSLGQNNPTLNLLEKTQQSERMSNSQNLYFVAGKEGAVDKGAAFVHYSHTADPYGTLNSIETEYGNAQDVAVDPIDCRVFFTTEAGEVLSVQTDGTEMRKLYAYDGTARGVDIDRENRHVYWTDMEKEMVLRGTYGVSHKLNDNMETLISDISDAYDIKVYMADSACVKIYITSVTKGIYSANCDGTGVSHVVTTVGARGITLNTASKTMYWSEYGNIYRAGMDHGANVTLLYSNPKAFFLYMDMDTEKMRLYASNHISKTIEWFDVTRPLDGDYGPEQNHGEVLNVTQPRGLSVGYSCTDGIDYENQPLATKKSGSGTNWELVSIITGGCLVIVTGVVSGGVYFFKYKAAGMAHAKLIAGV